MNKQQDPIYYSELECPVCKTKNRFGNIKVGSYTESGRDRDFKPTGRVWLNPAFQKYDPLLFFMATCSKCFYTREFNQDYKNWPKDSAFKTYRQKNIQQKHLSELSRDDSVIRFLGSHIEENKYLFESAVIKFLLGIYDTKILGRPSSLDLGRYFLRIAWLFRDHDGEQAGETNGAVGFFKQLKGAARAANQLIPSYEERVADLKRMVENDYSNILSSIPEAGRHKQRIEQIITDMASTASPLAEAGSKLMSVFVDIEKTLSGGEVSSEEVFHDHSSFADFLAAAREKWDEVPVNEYEALVKAREYYQKAYETGGEISQGIQQVQAAYMIAELSRRTGEINNANQFFNQTIRMGRELVMNKRADKSSVSFTKNLLEMAMEQARLNRKQNAGVTQ
jgi:hypothetical protein